MSGAGNPSATRFKVTDDLSLIAGARVVDWEAAGVGYGTSKLTEVSGKVLPHAGLVYRLGENYSVCASHTEGSTDEIGLKGQFFDGRLLATLAYYQSEQDNVAEFAGQVADPNNNQIPIDFYDGRNYASEGFDLTLSGRLAEGLQLDFSYARVDIDNRAVNGNNLTDEKYIGSLYWDQGFYGAPRSFSASVNWSY
ncbi:TonB-dependent receptor [Parahaliea maris]|uniref:TonB-dependent receptor n=2 Tax=Parahaliea maris TaxID=2716870 RepID=A0A5C8ZZM8_9GAMM|nr:TonB-dependent receptor [Parahaliea maris]